MSDNNPRYEIVFVGWIEEAEVDHETYEVAWSLEKAREIGTFIESLVGVTDSEDLDQISVPKPIYEENLIVTALDFVEQHVFSGYIKEYKGIYQITREKICN